MNKEINGSMKGSPFVNIAVLIIIFAGMIYAKSIITPFLLALFISIICAQPISWLERRESRVACAYHCIIGIDFYFFRPGIPYRRNLIIFFRKSSKYESTLTSISNTFIQFLSEKGITIPKDQISNLIQPAKSWNLQ